MEMAGCHSQPLPDSGSHPRLPTHLDQNHCQGHPESCRLHRNQGLCCPPACPPASGLRGPRAVPWPVGAGDSSTCHTAPPRSCPYPCAQTHTHTQYTRTSPTGLHAHQSTHTFTGVHTSPAAPTHPHEQAQLAERTHAHTHARAHTHSCTQTRCPQHPAGPEPAWPAKREMPALREATVGGAGWQRLSQPRELAGTWQGHRGSRGGWMRTAGGSPWDMAATFRPAGSPGVSSALPQPQVPFER